MARDIVECVSNWSICYGGYSSNERVFIMSYSVKQIAFEGSNHWVLDKGTGWFEVYKTGITASTKVATIHYSNDIELAKEKAISECLRRDNA